MASQRTAGFDESLFHIDWNAQKVPCPAGQERVSWTPAIDQYDNEVIKIQFSLKDCKPCPLKERCTKAPRRAISVRVKDHHQALQKVRARQKGAEFREKCRSRSGIEGTISVARSRLWPAAQSLSGLTENTFEALGDCGSDQPGANPGMVGWKAACQNAHFQIRCFSFGCLILEIRQQYQFAQHSPRKDLLKLINGKALAQIHSLLAKKPDFRPFYPFRIGYEY